MQAMAPSGKAPTRVVMAMMLFPLIMAILYPVMFLTAYHDPTPKDMDISVIESTKNASDVAHNIEVKGDGTLNVDTVDNVKEGKGAVTQRQTRAAYNPKTGDLYVASAGGKQATQAAQKVFQQVANQQDKTLHVHDLVPTAPKDFIGSGFMYMVMIGMITGYMTALMLNMFGRQLGLWRQLGTLAALAAAAGVIVTMITYQIYQVYDNHLVQSGLIVAGLFMVMGVVQLGLARLIGQVSALPGIILWIILGIPSSGLTVSPDMMYGFFRVVYKFHPLAAAGDLMRSNLYFGGQGIGRDIVLLAFWLVVGAGLLWLSTLRRPKDPTGALGGGVPQDGAGNAAVAGTPTGEAAASDAASSGQRGDPVPVGAGAPGGALDSAVAGAQGTTGAADAPTSEPQSQN